VKSFLRWVFADLWLHKKFSTLFVLNLSVGLTGFMALDSFRHHLETSLELKSQKVLGADIGLSSRKPITEAQKEAASKVLGAAPKTEMIETYSMVANTSGDSRLVQIKAIEDSFPFYGNIELDEPNPSDDGGNYDISGKKVVWVYPEVLIQLKLKVGDDLKIGKSLFKISHVVKDDSAAGFSTSMAPRVYIGSAFLPATQLITPESIAWHSVLYKKPMGPAGLEDTVKRIFESSAMDPGVQVYSHRSVSAQMSRMLNYLADYLGLVSIAAIFLASIGATFLFRSFIQAKIFEIAIFRSLGMSFRRTLGIYVSQILFLGLASSVLAFVLSLGLIPLLTKLLSGLVSVPILLSLRWQGLTVAFALGLVGALFIGAPILVSLRKLKPGILFQAEHSRLKHSLLGFSIHGFGLLSLWGLSVWQSKSWKVGSAFVGAFVLSGLILGGLTYLFLKLADRFPARTALSFRFALRNLARRPQSTIICFLALGLGMVLLNVVPQIEASLQAELENPEESKLPSFFLFDIQDDQIETLKNVVQDNQAKIGQMSPMIRGRLLSVNGKAFEKANRNGESFSREEQEEARFRNRGFNLSYRAELDDSEKLVEGEPFSGNYLGDGTEPAEISVEQRFAGRLGLKIRDQLVFEIQGVSVPAKIVNLRSVRWTSFQPNFFVQFQPGVLDLAPKTHIATIEDMPASKKPELQNRLVQQIPNVSIIDVSRIVKRLTEVSRQMSLALQFMALLCILVGLLVMYSIASHQALQRRKDINLIKVLGAPFETIRNFFLLEFAILASLAGLLGIGLSIGISYGISTLLFDSIWAWSPWVPFGSFFAIIVLVVGLAWLSVSHVLKEKPSFYL